MMNATQVDWEDKFRRLKVKFEECKVENRQHEDTVKKLKVANRRLENTSSPGRRNLGLTLKMNDHDEQQYDNGFRDQLCKLKLSNRELKETITELQQQVKNKCREIAYLKSLVANPRRNQRTKSVSIVESAAITEMPSKVTTFVQTNTTSSENDATVSEISKSFKMRLSSLKVELEEFKNENDQLRAQLRVLKAHAPETQHEPERSEGSLKAREMSTRFQQLQTEFEYLQTKNETQSHAFHQSEKKADTLNRTIRDMKRVLEDLQHEKAISDAKAARTVELEEQSRQLQQSNHNLELRLSSLCETPFIKEAFMRRDTLTKLEAAVQQADDYKVRVAHLQEAVKTHFSALNSLKEQLTKTQEDKDAVMKRAEELTVSQAQLLNSRQAVVEENERLESLLKLQSDISKQLHHDLERAVAEKEATIQETIELQRRLQESEDASITQSAQIRVLERATDHLRRQVREQIKDHSTVQSYQYEKNDFNVIQQQQSHKFHLELLSELLQGRRVEDLKRCENMLEIWVKSAVIESDIIAFDASTFVVIDFCTFESQSTTPVSGMNPCWDFGVTYKLTIDDFFLRFLAVDSITLELNIVCDGEVKLIGRCAVPLEGLLRESSSIQLQDQPVISVTSDEVVARISVDVSIALPVSELYRLRLRQTE